jgi:membrane associated rhomboid family serine protease
MRLPVATFSLIGANLAAFRLELAQGGLETCYAHGLTPAKFLATGDAAPVVSSLFLHDPGTLFHLGCNMLASSGASCTSQ